MADLSRYARQLVLQEIGEEGQKTLLKRSAVVLGIGGLGGVCATLLARMGVGRLRVVDKDMVSLDNLHRQILYFEEHIGIPKPYAGKETLARANKDCVIEPVLADVTGANVAQLIEGFDIVIDGSDNFQMRFIANEACLKRAIPYVHAAVLGTYALQFTILPKEGACYRCLFDFIPHPDQEPSGATRGIFSPAVAFIASLQVSEAIKLLLGQKDAVRRTLFCADLWLNEFREIEVAKNEDCEVCAKGIFRFL